MRLTGRHAAGLAVGAVVVLSFLAVKAESVDLQQHARYDADLVQLKELDTRINAGVLESRFELSASYDSLVSVLREVSAVRSALATPPAFVPADARRDLEQRLQAYNEVATEKESLVEQFKTDNAVFRNSLHYLPVLYDEIADNADSDRLDATTLSDVEHTVRAILLYNLTGDADLAAEVGTRVTSLRSGILPSSTSNSDKRLILFGNHVETILARKPTLDSLAQQLVSLPSSQRADELRAAYGHAYDRALETANAFRLILFAASVVLLSCTVFILARWRRATRALRFQAQHDALTGLANRALLQARLEEATRAAQRDDGSVTLLLMDLDRFKEVNDTLGHHAGDELLRQVAARLRESFRTSDTVARLGGDEFAVVLPGATLDGSVAAVRKLLHSLEAPCTIDGYSVDLEASIGIAVSPEHGHDARTLLRHADVAMYIAKADRTGYAVYAPNQDRHTTDRLGLVAELRNAIDAEQLFLHYQPKVDCRTGDVSGVEALVRWQHPQRGTIAPDQFIPLAEETGLIDPLTRWVLGEALRQSRAWQRNGLALPIAINLSMRNLQDPQLAQVVADLLALSDVPPSWLTLEITETAVMADPVRALAVLDQLRRTGVRIAIDDFGTGHTSLAYLRQIPADELKIDRSFIGSVLTDASGRAIVRSTIELSHSLALRVVAEGVEDEPTWRALAALGCDESQGYYLTRPLAPDALITWLRERRTPTTAAA